MKHISFDQHSFVFTFFHSFRIVFCNFPRQSVYTHVPHHKAAACMKIKPLGIYAFSSVYLFKGEIFTNLHKLPL